jgi:hypothetical protein
MEAVDYVVECANWKCLVSFNDANYTSKDSKLIEICTLAYEELFDATTLHRHVTLYSLVHPNGVDYFNNDELNAESGDIPIFKISILTKCYKSKDYLDDKKHYFIKSETLIENSSNHSLMDRFISMKIAYFKSYPKIADLIINKFGKKQIIKNMY